MCLCHKACMPNWDTQERSSLICIWEKKPYNCHAVSQPVSNVGCWHLCSSERGHPVIAHEDPLAENALAAAHPSNYTGLHLFLVAASMQNLALSQDIASSQRTPHPITSHQIASHPYIRLHPSHSSIMITASATVKKSPDPPTTRIVDTPSSSKSGRTFRTKAVMGSLSGATSAFIFSSLIMKFVAQVSWNMFSTKHPSTSPKPPTKFVLDCFYGWMIWIWTPDCH